MVRIGCQSELRKQYQNHHVAGTAAVTAIPLGPDVHVFSVDDEVMRGKFLTAMMDLRLMSFGEKTDYPTIGRYRAGLNLR